MTRYLATFEPQAWQNDYANPVLPEGETEWDCTKFLSEGNYVEWSGRLASSFKLVHGETYLDNDDVLKSDPSAPEWVRDWRGPFTITVQTLRCPLCDEPILVGDKTDQGEYGECHHNCPDDFGGTANDPA